MPPNNTYEGQLLIKGSGLTTVWPWRLILFSFLVFALTLIIYGTLAFGYRPYLKRQVELKDTEITQLAKAVPEEEQERFLTFYSQLINLKALLDDHVIPTPLLSWLESNTNGRVFYSSFNVKTNARELVLEGVTDSYETLAEQLEVFRGARELEDNSIQQSIRMPDGRIQFRVELTFKPSFFRVQ